MYTCWTETTFYRFQGRHVYTGIVFTVCCEPYLESEYGADYISETPVKLLDRLLYGQREHLDEEVRSRHFL